MEHERFPADLAPYLESHGYRVDKLDPFAFYLGAIHAVTRDADGRFTGVAEIRRDGTTGGV
ncbi:MAG: gamma-glutamyltransferase, partial [Ignavibacteria bacterium]|nr:gamma-glutamyltransferase [Ignavibacteria bacterium]